MFYGRILLSEIEDDLKDLIGWIHVFLRELTHVGVESKHVSWHCVGDPEQHHVNGYLLRVQHSPKVLQRL